MSCGLYDEFAGSGYPWSLAADVAASPGERPPAEELDI
jgi:hypothetical protein